MESRGRRGGGVGAAVAVAIALSAVLISACGGATSGPTVGKTEARSQQPLSQAELIAKADAICVSGQKAFRAVTRTAYPMPGQVSVPNPTERLPNVEYSEAVVKVAKRVVRELDSLTPAAQTRVDYEAYVHAEEEVEQLAEKALEASVEDNGGVYFKARKTRDAGALERANLAEAVGLNKCSPNPFFQ